MAYYISNICNSCTACETECPVGSIFEGRDHYEINPDICVDCGQCASICPVDAIREN